MDASLASHDHDAGVLTSDAGSDAGVDGGTLDGGPDDGGTTRDGGHPLDSGTLSYAADIQPIWDQHCVGCHNAANAQAGLALTADVSHAELMASQTPCSEQNQFVLKSTVAPGEAEQSALWIKLQTDLLSGPDIVCNREMPATGTALKWLDPAAFEKVERWIREGALDN